MELSLWLIICHPHLTSWVGPQREISSCKCSFLYHTSSAPPLLQEKKSLCLQDSCGREVLQFAAAYTRSRACLPGSPEDLLGTCEQPAGPGRWKREISGGSPGMRGRPGVPGCCLGQSRQIVSLCEFSPAFGSDLADLLSICDATMTTTSLSFVLLGHAGMQQIAVQPWEGQTESPEGPMIP